MDLAGKSVLITGGRRVGSELALMLAERGANVAMTYRTSREVIEETLARVRGSGVEGLPIEADLSNADRARDAVERVASEFGRIDILVNMASVFRRTPFAELTPADFDDMLAANLAAPYHTAVFAGQQMLRQEVETSSGLKGKIVNVGDWCTDRPYVGYLPYIVAKGGLTTFTRALAKELAPHVAVNMIQPAMIDPPTGMSSDEEAAVLSLTPLRRRGTPADANRLILYLLEGTDFATGSCFRIDGGRFLGVDPVDQP